MSALISDSLKTLLVRNFPANAAVFSALKQVYKRTTISPNEYIRSTPLHKRTGIVDTFRVFTAQLMPEMERTVEQNLLQNLFEHIKDERAKESILQAYHKRRLARLAYSRMHSEYQYYPPDVVAAEIVEPPHIFIDVSTEEQDAEDVASYARYPVEDMEKYFPKDCFGSYKSLEFVRSKSFGVMCTEEALTVMNYMRGVMLGINSTDFQGFLSAEDKSALLQDEHVYTRIYHLFSKDLIEAMKPYRKNLLFQKLFHTSPVFDALVNILVQEVKHPEFAAAMLGDINERAKILAQLLEFVEQKADHSNPNPLEIPYLMKVLGTLQLNLGNGSTHSIVFPRYKRNYKRLPPNISRFGFPGFHGINSGVLLHGDRGTGKSGTLLYLAMWAHKMNWIVVSACNIEKWTLSGEYELRRHNASGMFLQQEYTVEFLEQFKSANLELIRTIPVNMSIYGKYNGAGVHENDPEPAPNYYDPERKIFWKDYEKYHSFPEEAAVMERLDRDFEPPMSKHLPQPKSLLQIVNFGIDNPIYSTNALYELMEQLYNLEHPHNVLILVDQYNLLFRPSCYPSFRYENDRFLKGRIPPYHMALPRAFLHFDGHKIKNGYKVCGTGIPDQLFRHQFHPDDIYFPKGYQHEMKGLLLDDYRMMLSYYHHVKIWRPSRVEDHFGHEWLWTQTQGNWLQTVNILLKCADQ